MESGLGGQEVAYVAAWEERQRLLWENYAEGLVHTLTEVDAQLYDVCVAPPDSTAPGGLRRGVLERAMTRGRVDFHPEVSALRDRLDRPESYSSSPSPGEEMEPDVLALIRLRNRLARDLGFLSYGHLVMWSEGLDLDAVVEMVASLHREVLPRAVEQIRRREMTIPGWWDGIDQIAGPGPVAPDALARDLLERLGLSRAAEHLSWVVRDQPIAGFAAAVSVPFDVRILLGAGSSWHATGVAFHELGHAVAHVSNRGVGIDATWDTLHDESMAAIMEGLGAELLLDETTRRRMQTIDMLEAARLATSFLFEVEVNRLPRDARHLYASHYERLARIGDPADWAIDSFRSIDPFHVHNYVLGGVIAAEVRRHLHERLGDEHRRWGGWLVENLYLTGRAHHLLDKLSTAGVITRPGLWQIRAV